MKNLSTTTFSPDEREMLKKALAFSVDYHKKQQKLTKLSSVGHGVQHAKRVAGVASFIAIKEKKSPFLPTLAALIHDLGRVNKDKRSTTTLHGQLSREIATPFLKKLSLSQKDRNVVANAIEDHPYLNNKVRKSYVAQILMDADRLDSLGAITPVKAASAHWQLPFLGKMDVAFGEENSIDSIYGYFGLWVPAFANMMWTNTGRKIAKERVAFLKQFNKKFIEELNFMESCFKSLNI